MLKNAARRINIIISWAFVRLYLRKYKPIIIGVAGSVGKTGTKRAIAHVISIEKKVAWQDGNYNDVVTLPLIFFGLQAPPLFNPLAWAITYIKMAGQLINKKGADVVVLELGTDGPGQIINFGKFIKLDYAVVTAISYEHMEYFGNLDSVAKEELAVSNYSKKIYISDTIIKNGYINKTFGVYRSYGKSSSNDAHFTNVPDGLEITTSKFKIHTKSSLKGSHQYAALTIASEIAAQIGISSDAITSAVASLNSMPGRMSILKGKDNSILIDDSYNSSPVAVKNALQYLYEMPVKNRIAVLGNMNEMGNLSESLHKQLAEYCDPIKLNELITIGEDINRYLVPIIRSKGIKVVEMKNPYDIGDYLVQQKLNNTAILFKGSQNGVFLEEAIKAVLADKADVNRLVRQSEYWLKRKKKQFNRGSS